MKSIRTLPEADKPQSKVGLVPLLLSDLTPSPENDGIYRVISPDDPEILHLADSIRERGILEPIVVSRDRYIISGHRRHCAAELAGLEHAMCRVLDIERGKASRDEYVRLLRAFNHSRLKDAGEQFRESVIDSDPEEVYRALLAERQKSLSVDLDTIQVRERSARKSISEAKRPFLDAVSRMVRSLRKHWPLSDRQIHYRMLNTGVLRNSNRPSSVYKNDLKSYKDLTDILTRARINGLIPFAAIEDPTRPAQEWDCHSSPAAFVRGQLHSFLKNYWRDPMQSQPSYIEIHCEKNTVYASCKRAASNYGIPVSSGRGFASLPARRELLGRFEKSGKERLAILYVADFDPEGVTIPHAFTRSLIDDFGVDESIITPVRVALTPEQISQYKLPPMLKAKKSSTNYKRFVRETGSDDAFELESLPPDAIEGIVTEAIESVVDRDFLNAEIEAERSDAIHIEKIREQAKQLLQSIDVL
jgi:hypothetical protein